jgi:predicted MFS family arabinose efflux permease
VTAPRSSSDSAPPSEAAGAPLRPFHHRTFAVIWTATVVSNIGTWMYSAAAAWLMTDLSADPLVVSLVQVATSLPMFLFALPAGALADIVDKRRLLIGAEIAFAILSAMLAALVAFSLVTPLTLLLFTFLIGAASALTAPAWQSIVPSLIPRRDLHAAIAANSVGINISRAIGPALGGLFTAAAGIAAPFWVNAFSNLGSIGALVWWRPAHRPASQLPAERFMSAMRAGVRYARHNPPFRATVIRAIGFFLFASAYWALLPLVARTRIAGGAQTYGILLGAIGASAVLGALALPRLKKKLGADRLVAAGTLGTAATVLLYGIAHDIATALAASLMAGVSWIAVLSSLNVSAQLALPEWVRGRGLALYVTAFFGAMTLCSALWGQVAGMTGLPVAHFLAAAGALLTIPLTWRWKLQTGAGLDLTPSMHWPSPVTAQQLEQDAGPVMITVEYRIDIADRNAFLHTLERLAAERRRDGAYAWGAFEDTTEPGRIVETFLVESWLEHLRQHERVTNADRALQERLERLLRSPAKVSHLIAARAGRSLHSSPPPTPG